MTPKLLKRLMERQWRNEPCSDPLCVACWCIEDRKLVKLLPDDDDLVFDHDGGGPARAVPPFDSC
jgi:hypothetical protein